MIREGSMWLAPFVRSHWKRLHFLPPSYNTRKSVSIQRHEMKLTTESVKALDQPGDYCLLVQKPDLIGPARDRSCASPWTNGWGRRNARCWLAVDLGPRLHFCKEAQGHQPCGKNRSWEGSVVKFLGWKRIRADLGTSAMAWPVSFLE